MIKVGGEMIVAISAYVEKKSSEEDLEPGAVVAKIGVMV